MFIVCYRRIVQNFDRIVSRNDSSLQKLMVQENVDDKREEEE